MGHRTKIRRRGSELSADDLRTWRGVVLGRAVSTLRSVETQPSAWGFVLSVRRDPITQAHVRPSDRPREIAAAAAAAATTTVGEAARALSSGAVRPRSVRKSSGRVARRRVDGSRAICFR